MARAQETSMIIEKFLPKVETKNDSILVEGLPIPPEPPIGRWRPEFSVSCIIYYAIFFERS